MTESQHRTYSKWAGRYYMPLVPPQADDEMIAAVGERLMFRHGSACHPDSQMFAAPLNEITAGWVLGIFEPAV